MQKATVLKLYYLISHAAYNSKHITKYYRRQSLKVCCILLKARKKSDYTKHIAHPKNVKNVNY